MRTSGRAALLVALALSVRCTDAENVTRSYEHERRLVGQLLNGYDRNTLPVSHSSDAVRVTLDIAINQIINVDEPNSAITTSVWLRIRWVDKQLTWRPEDYGGIEHIRLFASRIWIPDLTLYNDVRMEVRDVEGFYPVIVSSNGSCFWLSPRVLASSCELNIKYFPWDEQYCPLHWGSWSYDGTKIDLTNSTLEGDTAEYQENGEWDLIKFPAIKYTRMYSCCVEPYPSVRYWIVMVRKPLYYIFNLILPCIFITATTILVFYLPVESGEKVSLSVTVLLALAVFMLMLAEQLPPQSDVVPVIGLYFGLIIMMIAVSTVMTVIIINVHHRGSFNNKVPAFVRTLVLRGLATVLCVRTTVDRELQSQEENQHSKGYDNLMLMDQSNGNKEAPPSNGAVNQPHQRPHSPENGTMNKMLRAIDRIANYFEDKKDSKFVEDEFKLVAMVVDRLFLVVFTIATLVLTVVCLTQHPGKDTDISHLYNVVK